MAAQVDVHDEGHVRPFLYSGTREQLEGAQHLIGALAHQHGWVVTVDLKRWHPAAEDWEDPKGRFSTVTPRSPSTKLQRRPARDQRLRALGEAVLTPTRRHRQTLESAGPWPRWRARLGLNQSCFIESVPKPLDGENLPEGFLVSEAWADEESVRPACPAVAVMEVVERHQKKSVIQHERKDLIDAG